MQYKAVLFDLDGTLVDSLEDLADSMNTVLARAGFPLHDVERYKYFVGEGVEKLVYRALPEDRRNDEVLTRCVAAMREEYGKRWDQKTRPYEGIPELLDVLIARGVKLAVLSNKPDDFTKKIVRKLLPNRPFDPVFGARPSVPKKPDPVAAIEIAEYLSISPKEFLYLGDTKTDMETAVGAGMYPVGALWGFRAKEELLEGGAKTVIDHPPDLTELLER